MLAFESLGAISIDDGRIWQEVELVADRSERK